MLGISAFSLVLLAAQGAPTSGRITGQVTDAASGAPITGARVTLMMVVDVPGGTFGRRPRQSATDANGAFAFDGLDPAQYIVNVEKSSSHPSAAAARSTPSRPARRRRSRRRTSQARSIKTRPR
jgi:hypothetical protein